MLIWRFWHDEHLTGTAALCPSVSLSNKENIPKLYASYLTHSRSFVTEGSSVVDPDPDPDPHLFWSGCFQTGIQVGKIGPQKRQKVKICTGTLLSF
jgi:hypothetical protein